MQNLCIAGLRLEVRHRLQTERSACLDLISVMNTGCMKGTCTLLIATSTYIVCGSFGRYTPHLFAAARKAYETDARNAMIEVGLNKKTAYDTARQLWMASALRATLLHGMSLGELKRRRFI